MIIPFVNFKNELSSLGVEGAEGQSLVEKVSDAITGAYKTCEGYVDISVAELFSAIKQSRNPFTRINYRDASNYAFAAACLEIAKGPYFDEEAFRKAMFEFRFNDYSHEIFHLPSYKTICGVVEELVHGDSKDAKMLRRGLVIALCAGNYPFVLSDAIVRYVDSAVLELRKRSIIKT